MKRDTKCPYLIYYHFTTTDKSIIINLRLYSAIATSKITHTQYKHFRRLVEYYHRIVFISFSPEISC